MSATAPAAARKRVTSLSSGIALTLLLIGTLQPSGEIETPNVLWLSSEDNGPQLGAYGDAFADTPNLDALAELDR